jgi:hypothetical protein
MTVSPHIVIPGAARSGTTSLAAVIALHPRVDAPSIKEPNFYTWRFDYGETWYRDLYRNAGGLRLDASVTYGFPSQIERALVRMQPGPETRFVYLVREPVERVFSHYNLAAFYQDTGANGTLGDVLVTHPQVLDASRYDLVLASLADCVGEERVLVVPFELVTRRIDATARIVLDWLGLDAGGLPDQSLEAHSKLFANERRAFKLPAMRWAYSRVRHTSVYPAARRLVGAERMRRLRGRLTSTSQLPTIYQGLASCTPEQTSALEAVFLSARTAVSEHLKRQDERLRLAWVRECEWLYQPAFDSQSLSDNGNESSQ